MHDLLIDMKNQNKPGNKMNISFYKEKEVNNELYTFEVSYGTTIDQTLKYYLRKINRTEFINSNKIKFSFGEKILRFGDNTPIEIFFKSSTEPKIYVNFPFAFGFKLKKWFNWTDEEVFQIKDEFDKMRLESNALNSKLGEKLITVQFNKEGSIIKITRSNYIPVVELIIEYFVKSRAENFDNQFKFNGHILSFKNLINLYETLLKNDSKSFLSMLLKDNSEFLESLYKLGLEDNSEIIVN